MENDRNAKRRAHRAANLELYREKERSYYARNQARQKQNRQNWKKANPDKVRAINRRHKFGITKAEWDAQFEAQARRCAICLSEDSRSDKDWATDHCHSTGRLRAILCQPCNKMLGHSEDRPAVLRAAANYLETFARLFGK